MAQGNIVTYLGNSGIETREGDGKTFVKVYNDTGSAVSNGAIKVISLKFVSGQGVIAAVAAPATNDFDVNVIGIVANSPSSSIANLSYGWVQVYGLYGTDTTGATTSGTVAANDRLEVLNAGVAFIDAGTDGGAVETPESCAVAVANVTTNVWQVFLLGKRSSIKAA